MLDLTSSLFLGLHHGSDELGGWATLTTGRAAALGEPDLARRVAARVAANQGAAAGVVHRSALHALVDVVDVLAPTAVVVDAHAYPLAGLAAGSAAARRGTSVRTFAHHDAGDARRVLTATGARRPVLVTDGWCVGCNRPAPLADLERAVREHGGTLVVDDTQAYGVLGHRSGQAAFGHDGGGTWRWSGGRPVSAVQVVSLAKGLGAPVAVTTGPRPVVDRLATHGTRWHSSAPTSADLLAADRATAPRLRDELAGRRRRLWALVQALRDGLRRLGLHVTGLPFPLVHVRAPSVDPVRLVHGLCALGVRGLALAPACHPTPTLTFALRADLTDRDVHTVLGALRVVLAQGVAA